jgi:hypothetical protein
MAITDETEPTATTVTAVVAVRIPDSSDADLETDAERRLGRIDGVQTVTVDELRGLEPQLSATVVTVAVTIESTVPAAELRERLTSTVSVERVDRLETADETA